MFKKVLIANRGAIAVRIARTLKNMGIMSIAVYTKADRDSLHVDAADEAVLIGEGPASESYLNGTLILNIAQKYGAEAIHPGYGFLSENKEFARLCLARGLTFIGPTPEQIALFGQKHQARAIAEKAGVPVVPGSGLLEDVDEALERASFIGYPVMLKATAGGGGIGIETCSGAHELKKAFESLTRIASSQFHEGALFMEKYIPRARHIEVQIFGQHTGEIVTLGERDCSLQRRNQKIVEESPAPGLAADLRRKMEQAAKILAQTVHYRNVGTVEFIYDISTSAFYFLEMNTRIQVEHGVSEELFGIDLVEWQILEAAGENVAASFVQRQPKGHSIELRLYAEDAQNQFRPSSGILDTVELPDNVRVETWVRKGTQISPFYDPLLAKIIVWAATRTEALIKMQEALDHTHFYGVSTNREYLRALLSRSEVLHGNLFTQFLADFHPPEPSLEVIDPGIHTTVQDWPGRMGYWQVGVPPSGAMDPLSFRLGNLLLGNDPEASGLELTLRGGKYRFRDDIRFCVTGAPMNPTLDGVPIPLYQPTLAKRGQELHFDEAKIGMRTYLTIAGGFDVPTILGSHSTFTLGGFGGHAGRALQIGDVLAVKHNSVVPRSTPYPASKQPVMTPEWTIGVILGPHCSTEFLDPGYLGQLIKTRWEVHFNSSRTGVRLIGPAPSWARADGGDAGLHPSNIHDNAYAIGTLDLTGDMPIFLGPDGPSLGGFVCPVTAASAELWKIGQLRPGDRVSFRLVTLEEAEKCLNQQETFLQNIESDDHKKLPQCSFAESEHLATTPNYPLLHELEHSSPFPLTIRIDGNENLLAEYGPMELDLRLRFQVHALMTALENDPDLPIIDLTPGIRSLQIHIDPGRISLREVAERVHKMNRELPSLEAISVPSRIVPLPLSWDDPATQLAILRYQQNVRPDAPWCPSNLEFIRRINGLKSVEDVKDIVFSATYLVLGLGDVYLGAPVATPLDPRHRLITTKYNPARTWTPENAVGIGGAYLCVYGMEGPGGYQFVGRTLQMWNKWRNTRSFEPGRPWLLRFFDQIQFYPVSAEELLQLREDFIRGRFEPDIRHTIFDLNSYLQELDYIQDSAKQFHNRQQQAFQAERERWRVLGLADYVSADVNPGSPPSHGLKVLGIPVHSHLPGSVWKVSVNADDVVNAGDALVVLESMKMEFAVVAPCDGTIAHVHVKPGDQVQVGQLLADIVESEMPS